MPGRRKHLERHPAGVQHLAVGQRRRAVAELRIGGAHRCTRPGIQLGAQLAVIEVAVRDQHERDARRRRQQPLEVPVVGLPRIDHDGLVRIRRAQ